MNPPQVTTSTWIATGISSRRARRLLRHHSKTDWKLLDDLNIVVYYIGMIGLHGDQGKENDNYYWGYIGSHIGSSSVRQPRFPGLLRLGPDLSGRLQVGCSPRLAC